MSLLGGGYYGLGGYIPPSTTSRRAFFSFHFQNDIHRACQVRNSWRFGHEKSRIAEGRFMDASLWEAKKREAPETLKAYIRDGMKNTSVTCVLAGSTTYTRPWVRYEIARSVVKGNGLLTVKIHNLKHPQQGVSYEGPDPLAFMAVYRAPNNSIYLAEHNGLSWIQYPDWTLPVTIPKSWYVPAGNLVQLSSFARCHCYVAGNGYLNLSSWIDVAANGLLR